MSGERWIIVRNWARFQHYSDRRPTWIKLYTDLAHDADWTALTDADRGLLARLWIGYALADGRLTAGDVLADRRRDAGLKRLEQAGFIEFSASKPLSLTRARARSREEEPTVEEEPLTPRERGMNPRAQGTNPRAVAKRDRPRRNAERWIANGLAAQYPPETLADVIADEFKITDPDLLEALVTKALETRTFGQ